MSGFTHAIAGGNGVLVVTALQSPNYAAGIAGWAIFKSGDAEFNNATFRGTVIATEFGAQVVVTSGPYAGTYTIEAGAGGASDQDAVLQWINGTHPAYVPSYVAGITGPGAGNVVGIHSGQETSGDQDAVLFLLSATANDGSRSQAQLNADEVLLFGAGGPVLVPAANGASGAVVDSWHALSMGTGWSSSNGVAGFYYTQTLDGNLLLAWDVKTSTAGNANPIATVPFTLPTAVRLGTGWASGAPSTYTPAFGPGITVQANGQVIAGGIGTLSSAIELFGTAVVPLGAL